MAKRKPMDFSGSAPAVLTDEPFYGFNLDEEQAEFRDAIWNKEKLIVFCNAKAGTGKAQPVDTVIPTPNGFKKLGDIKSGDYVFDKDGKPTRVLGVFPQGMQKAYEVELNDGRKTICCDEHLWSYYPLSGSLQNKFVTETLHSMMQRKFRGGNRHSPNRYAIPVNNAVEYEEKDFTVDPYVVGAFIGDGCCTDKTLCISSEDEEIPNEIGRLIGGIPVKCCDNNYNWVFDMDEEHKKYCFEKFNLRSDTKQWKTHCLFDDIPEVIGGCREKRIPEKYKFGSIEQRYSLIQGLFDTDGSIVETNYKYGINYSSVNLDLMKDIKSVLNSLGYCATIHERKRENRSTEYELHVFAKNSDKQLFFRLKRKKDIAKKASEKSNYKKYDRIQICGAKDLGYECEMVCIYVDNPEHLYLTNDYIVTHNTQIAVGMANMLYGYGLYDGIVCVTFPCAESKQGFLPGDITQKSEVYFEPIYQAMIKCGIVPMLAVDDSTMTSKKEGDAYIKLVTSTYLRGTNFENKVVIIDEAQNGTLDDLKKVLTRCSDSCKVIVTGHTGQIDLANPRASGFSRYLEHFSKDERAAICKLTQNYRGWISSFADELEN